jgi:hypothetical protein
MDPQLIGYNRRRQRQAQRRRWRLWANLTAEVFLRRGSQAQLAKQLGVHRSTVCRDLKAWWAWVRETREGQR